jgi:glycosyltransferase involved in cell wall biosynthesis
MIESVRAQTMEDWELIIVDDGSTEDIAALVNGFNDQRIMIVRWEQNRGIPHGLNHAFTLATGDYVQPLSADEWIDENKLALQVAYLDGNPQMGACWGLPGKGPMGVRPEWEQYALGAHNRSREAWVRTLVNLENIPIGGAGMLMRTSIMHELNGFAPQHFHCSDLELFVRFFRKHDGHILCARLADADQPEERLTAPSQANAERFQKDIALVREIHKVTPPPATGRVTVGIPVHNMAQHIGSAIGSLKQQTLKDFDIVVLDDASTDKLDDALEPYAADIKLMKFEENMGVRHAVNAMIAQCDTEYLVSLAADDKIEPTYLERALAEFAEDPWLEFVASQTDFIDDKGQPLPDGSHDVQKIERAANKTQEQWLQRLYYGNVYFGVGMYRTSALKQLGGLDTEAGVLTDYDLYLKLLQRNNIKIIEENLTHTRIWEGNASVGPGKLDGQWLKEKYAELKKRYYRPRMKCIICTPFYEMRGFSPYITSIFYTAKMLAMVGIDAEFWELAGDSYVDRAKNTLFTKFLEDPEATDLFMIDSDMQWEPQSITKLLALPEPIVVGSYPQKNSWSKWTSTPALVDDEGTARPIGRVLEDGTALIKAEYMAGGFVRIKRHLLEEYRAKFTEDQYQDASADSSVPERKYTNFFQCEVRDGLRWGEDRFFGKRLKEMGVDVFIYPNIEFGHYGVKGFFGNFDKWLRNPELQKNENPEHALTQRVA